MRDLAVRLEAVSKRFGRQTAVDSVDLQVPTGSIYGFIGPNGSGKTTTMRLILRIYRPDAGRLSVLGRDDLDAADPRVGYLPEERGLYRRMKVDAVIRYFARLKGLSDPERLIDDQLERLGASDWKKKRIDQLSKGMAQKVQFAIAMLGDPQLVILDEPFSGLDPVNMNLLRDLVLRLRDRGATVIFSTHDMSVAQQMCDHVFMIYRGKKVLDGTIDSIRQQHSQPRVRVRLADLSGPSAGSSGDWLESIELPGVVGRSQVDGFTELTLVADDARAGVLDRLIQVGDIEHFETVRPTLHDIFVDIVQPENQAEQSPQQGRNPLADRMEVTP